MSNKKKTSPISKIGRVKQISRWILDKLSGATKNSITSKVELVNKTIDFSKGLVRKTYKVTIVIYKSNIVHKVISFSIVSLFSFRLRFGLLNQGAPGIETRTQIERKLEQFRLTEEDNVKDMKCSQSPSVQQLLKINGGIKIKQGLVHVQKVLHDVQSETILVTLE